MGRRGCPARAWRAQQRGGHPQSHDSPGRRARGAEGSTSAATTTPLEEALAAIVRLEARIDSLEHHLATEVRTRRLVVVDDHGRERSIGQTDSSCTILELRGEVASDDAMSVQVCADRQGKNASVSAGSNNDICVVELEAQQSEMDTVASGHLWLGDPMHGATVTAAAYQAEAEVSVSSHAKLDTAPYGRAYLWAHDGYAHVDGEWRPPRAEATHRVKADHPSES